jgi:hypothetical protein
LVVHFLGSSAMWTTYMALHEVTRKLSQKDSGFMSHPYQGADRP